MTVLCAMFARQWYWPSHSQGRVFQPYVIQDFSQFCEPSNSILRGISNRDLVQRARRGLAPLLLLRVQHPLPPFDLALVPKRGVEGLGVYLYGVGFGCVPLRCGAKGLGVYLYGVGQRVWVCTFTVWGKPLRFGFWGVGCRVVGW